MSYPPPAGFRNGTPTSGKSTPQPHPSLPARPPQPAGPLPSFKPAFAPAPPSTSAAPGTRGYGGTDNKAAPAGFGGFTAFKPRTVAAPAATAAQSWNYQATASAPPQYQLSYTASAQPSYSSGYQASQYQSAPQTYYQPPSQASPPQIQNPFPAPGQSRGGASGGYDPDLEAQIAQWQSAYVSKDDQNNSRSVGRSGRGEGPASAGGANAIPLGNTRNQTATPDIAAAAPTDSGVASVVSGPDGKQKTVVRSGGGQTWSDSSLLEWDPAHFRLFVGNLAGEVTDESLLKAFVRYPSVQKARVIRDKRTTKSRGYGFVSFSNGDDYFNAAKEMQGKYIGSHPVLIKRSTTEIKASNPVDKRKHGQHGKGGNKEVGGHANTGAGVHKNKPSKTKNGLKILG